MGIQFAVHTYGHFEAMFYVLNGIKMIMNSDFASSMIKLMALVALSYYSVRGMAEASQVGIGVYIAKTIGMLLVISALIVPKADMLVVDRISARKEVISGLPYAFVLPVGILEAIGAGITSLFEQAFVPVSSMAYKDYGLIFGQRLVQESKNWRIANPEFANNMNIFIRRCVVLESMIGNRFTPEDIFNSSDIFGLVTERAGTFRLVDLFVNKKIERVNCIDAGKILKTYLKPELEFLNFKYKGSDYAVAGKNSPGNMEINKLLNRNLEVCYASSLGVKSSAENILRQNLMINALKDFNNRTDKYGYTRADDLQKSNWKISGELAKEYLPLLLNIIKALIYASFIFVVPLMILSGGITHYLKYCAVVFSLQIWPALNAVLNLFIELYSNFRCSLLTHGDLTFWNFNQAHAAIDNIVLVASGLQMSIPFLSFAIVQGGVGSFVHLANSLQGASAAASGTASTEITSGNRSFDNISKDSTSIGNKSGFKTDFNQLYQEGATQIQGADGSIIRTSAGGDGSITSGAGVNKSSGSRALFMEDGTQIHYQDSINKGLNAIKSDEQHYQESQNSAINTTTDLVSYLAQKQVAGESINLDKTTEEGRAMEQMINNTVSMSDRDGYDFNQSAEASVLGYIEAGVPIPIIKGSVGGRIEGSVSAENSSSQSLDKEISATRSNDTSRNLNILLKAGSNEHYLKDNEMSKNLAQSTRANYDKMQSYGQSISQRKEEVENYSSALHASQNKGSSDRRDMYHDLEQNISKQYGVSQEVAHQMIESNDLRANKVWDAMVKSEVAQELAQVKSAKNNVIKHALQDEIGFHNEHSGKINDQSQKDLQKQASLDGLDANLMNTRINQTQSNVGDKQKDMTKNANEQIHAVEHYNKVKEQGMDRKIKEYEKDRIGQGKVARTIGKTLGNIPFTDLGSNIGGMEEDEKTREYLKDKENTLKPKNEK